jgi:hypothetical protein
MNEQPGRRVDDRLPPSWLNTRAAVTLVTAVACAATAALLCGTNTLAMVAVACLDGGAAALWVGGAAGLGAAVLRACRVPVGGPLGVSTAGGLGLGIFSLAGLGLGLLGWLNRPVALAFPVVGYALLVVDLARRGVVRRWGGEAVAGWMRRPAGASWLWAVVAVSLTFSVVAASMWPAVLWRDSGDPHPYDVTSYHLQVPREWYDAGRIVPLRHNMFSYFPMNVEVQYLLLMHAGGGGLLAPWRAMYECQFVSVACTLLMLLAVAGAVGERGGGSASEGPRFGPPIAAAGASAVPWVMMLGGVAYVEAALLLYTALAVAWAMRAVNAEVEPRSREGAKEGAKGEARGRNSPGGPVGVGVVGYFGRPLVREPPALLRRPLIVAGVMAGLACGVKITAVPMLAVAVPLAVVAAAAGRAVRWRRLVVGLAAFGLAAALVVSPWLVRTATWAGGNPVWPVGMSVLGRGHFSAGQVERFTVAHSPVAKQRPADARFGVLWRDVLAHWQYGYVLLPAAALAAAMRWRDRQTRVLVVTAMVVLVVWFGFTHLLARFLVMAVPLAAVLVGRASAGRWWPAGLAVVVIGAVSGWAGVAPALTKWTLPAGNEGLFGLDNFDGLITDAPELRAALAGDGPIGIVGDAQAFLYQVPMSRLHYRTVFDLPAGVTDPVAAWVGPEAEGNREWMLVINPAEIARLHQTYRDTPPLPPAWSGERQPTFLLRGDQVGRGGSAE